MAIVDVVCDSISYDAAGDPHCHFDDSVLSLEPDVSSTMVDLLTFDLATFSVLMGTCTVIFILSYAGGLVVRNMLRV